MYLFQHQIVNLHAFLSILELTSSLIFFLFFLLKKKVQERSTEQSPDIRVWFPLPLPLNKLTRFVIDINVSFKTLFLY